MKKKTHMLNTAPYNGGSEMTVYSLQGQLTPTAKKTLKTKKGFGLNAKVYMDFREFKYKFPNFKLIG